MKRLFSKEPAVTRWWARQRPNLRRVDKRVITPVKDHKDNFLIVSPALLTLKKDQNARNISIVRFFAPNLTLINAFHKANIL